MLKKLALIIVGLLGAFAVVVAMQPDTYKVTRSTTIAAAPETIFPIVNNYRRWDAWSPWAKLDPQMTVSFSGPEAGGVGATYSWKGNSDVGAGKMTTLEADPNRALRIQLDFIEPFADTSNTIFTFTPSADAKSTTVTWDMAGNANFISKAMCLFVSMDSMLGPDFEKGLASLKALAESNQPKN
jgi:uncharacterized protein YndB with AHSA1/START domain